MKFKEFILKTSLYKEDTIDTMLNDYFKDIKNVVIDDTKYSVLKESDGSNVLYIRVLVIYHKLKQLKLPID